MANFYGIIFDEARSFSNNYKYNVIVKSNLILLTIITKKVGHFVLSFLVFMFGLIFDTATQISILDTSAGSAGILSF